MYSQDNVLRVFIGKDVAQLADGTLVDAYGDMLDGQIACVTLDNKAETDLSTVDTFRFVTRQGTQLFYSPVMKVSDIQSVARRGYTADQEQITYIGSNGTSGSFEVSNSKRYTMRVQIVDPFKTFGNKELYKIASYNSGASATEEEIALGLWRNLVLQFKNESEDMIKIDLINSDAGSAMGAAADTVIGSKGSKTITVTDTGGDTSVTAVAAGDYIRLGTATTSPIYKVKTSTVTTAGGTLTLYDALLEDVSLLGTTSEKVVEADAKADNFGIKMTGQARSNFRVGAFKFYKNRFKVFLTVDGDSSTTTVEYNQLAKEGNGNWEQVAEIEWFANGNEQNYGYRVQYPGDAPLRSVVDSTKTYEDISLRYFDKGYAQVTGGTPVSLQEMMLIYEKDSTQGDAMITTLNTIPHLSLSAFPA